MSAPNSSLQTHESHLAPRQVVVVLGMHRSGTSLVAGCLQRLGIDFGPRLMPPDANNPRGYFEHNDIVNLHDRLLLTLDRSWDDPAPFPDGWWQHSELLLPYRERILAVLRRDFAAAPLWGLKDPRLCRLLPWWETLWPEVTTRPLFVLVRRDPAAVAVSLARRDGMSPAKALSLWLRHTLEAEAATRGHDRLLLDFADFLRDEWIALEPVRHRLGLSAQRDLPPLVDPGLGTGCLPARSLDLPPLVQAVDAALLQGLRGDELAMRIVLDRATEQGTTAAAIFFPRTAQETAGDLEGQLAVTRKQARWYEAEWRKAQSQADQLAVRLARAKQTSAELKSRLRQK